MSEYIKLNDEIRFGINVFHPSGGYLVATDETPRWSVFEQDSDTAILAGDFTARSNLPGTYRGSLFCSGVLGFDAGNYYEIHASGKVSGLVGRTVCKTFVLNDLYDVNVISWSGSYVGPQHLNSDIYFANIKYVKDAPNTRDEFSAIWFKNDQPVTSGSLSNPAISVYNTSNGTASFENQSMSYASTNLGVVRYNNGLLPSGEPFLCVVSGLIDGSSRSWRQVIGLDVYY